VWQTPESSSVAVLTTVVHGVKENEGGLEKLIAYVKNSKYSEE
jgi:hypothetical protein